ALMPIVVCALGWLAAMGIWWWAFGNELFLALIIVLIKGNELREVLNVPLSTYLVYITTWPGGLWPVAGIILAVLNLAWSIGTRVTRRFPLSRGDMAALFLTINLSAYFLLFMIFFCNKYPQYVSKFFFLAMSLAAFGYAQII